MPSHSRNFGQYLYGLRQEKLGNAWKAYKKANRSIVNREFKNFQQWIKGPEAREIYKYHSKENPHYQDLIDTWRGRGEPSTTPYNDEVILDDPDIANEYPFEHIENFEGETRETLEKNREELYDYFDRDFQSEFDEPQAGPSGIERTPQKRKPEDQLEAPSPAKASAGEPSPAKGQGSQGTMAPPNVQLTGQIAMADPTIAGAAGIGGSASSGAVGNRANSISSAGYIKIPRSLPMKPAIFQFRNTYVFYCYAYATTNIDANSNLSQVTTPLAYIPVDYIPFYISAAEWGELPRNSKAVSLECNVRCLGTRTAFDTGQTVSGVGTTEYVGIGCTAIGLNRKLNMFNGSYSSAATNSMLPTAVKEIWEGDYIRRLWSDVECASHCIPRQLTGFAVMVEFQSNTQKVGNPAVDTPYGTNYGRYRLDKHVDRYLVSSSVGQPVASYRYKPKRGYLKDPLPTIPNGLSNIPRANAPVNGPTFYPGVMRAYPGSLISRQQLQLTGDPSVGNDPFTARITDNQQNANSIPAQNPNGPFNYMSRIERLQCYDTSEGTQSHHTQPQLHVGMFAIPQLNPATANNTFLNSCIYYEITTKMDVEVSWNSITENQVSCEQTNAVFIDNYFGIPLGVSPYGFESNQDYPTSITQIRPNYGTGWEGTNTVSQGLPT